MTGSDGILSSVYKLIPSLITPTLVLLLFCRIIKIMSNLYRLWCKAYSLVIIDCKGCDHKTGDGVRSILLQSDLSIAPVNHDTKYTCYKPKEKCHIYL